MNTNPPPWCNHNSRWKAILNFHGVQNYVFALRACLKEMEADDSDEYALQEKLAYLTHDLVSHCIGSTLLIA